MKSISRNGMVAMVFALGLGVVGFAQPERKEGPARQPRTEHRFYARYHVSTGDDGRQIYLWGFDPETAETVLVASEQLPDDWEDLRPTPGNFRDYFFAEANDGTRIFVWGYNPGAGHFRLVSTARTQRPERGIRIGPRRER